MLGIIKLRGEKVSVDTAMQGGSVELILARRHWRWVVYGYGSALNY